MTREILVLSASVGAGHLRAAQAVELALRELAPEATVQNVDVLELTNAAFRHVYGRAYLDLIARAPHMLGYFYDLMDQPRSPRQKSDRLRRLVEKLNLGKFLRLLHSRPWECIVNTHFLPAELIANLRRDQRLATPHFTVTTDFETHRLWVNQPCDHYFTATVEGRAYLVHWGVPAADISVTGIPIHPVFRHPPDRAQCLTRQGLAGDRPILLQLAGGFGVGPVERIHRELLSLDRPLELVVVAGRNAELKAHLETIEVPARHRRLVLGFTDQMDELLAVADIVLSKPGGLTTSEILARGAALAIVNPIPGQETRNSDYLLEHGAAIKINNLGTLGFKIGQLLDDPQRLAQLKQQARRLGRPEAAFDIARTALDWHRLANRFDQAARARVEENRMDLQLGGAVAVVAGGARGIGRAIAAALVAEGARVALWDLATEVRPTAEELAAGQGSARGWTLDVTELAAVERVADEIEAHFGPVEHVFFAVAIGSGQFGAPFWKVDPAVWERVLRINLIGAVNVAQVFGPRLAAARRGTMLFLSSVAGQIGSQTDPPYSASKAGLINFAQCAAKDLAPFGVRVNTLCPGMVQTVLNRAVWQSWADRQPADQWRSYEDWTADKIRQVVPLNRWQTPEDLAAMAVFLASRRAENVTGQTINVDGGFVMHW